jgi:hydroxymethylbilane synthase
VDGAVLAWAGLRRLGVEPAHLLELPLEEFPPAPGQGALAVQARQDGPALLALLRRIHDPATWTEVSAERAFLRHLGGGCHAPAAALGRVTREGLELHGQIFGGGAMVSGRERGADPLAVGAALAERLAAELREAQR